MSTRLPYQHPVLRDLVWALGSPPLIHRADAGVHWLDTDWFANICKQYQSWFRALERDPRALQTVVDNRSDRRLGNYFETLWRFWLDANDRYRLLYANLPLRSKQRTIGEFDFLVRDLETGKTLHWELAVKFYLGVGDTSRPANWWGPAQHDRLDIKLDRLLEHQSKLSQRSEARRLFSELGMRVDETWLILKGRLFYPANQPKTQPLGACKEHLRGFWISGDSVSALNDGLWQQLDRQQWFAELLQVSPSACVDSRTLARQIEDEPLAFPLCVARIRNGMEVERGFIVPTDWSEGIVQSP